MIKSLFKKVFQHKSNLNNNLNKMIIDRNGIKIEAVVEGASLKYKVLEQSSTFTNNLKLHQVITDSATGFNIRSNLKPAYKHKSKRFYVRGFQQENHNDEVLCEFDYASQAQQALQALERLVDKVIQPEDVQKLEHKKESQFKRGGTSYLRNALLTKQQAIKLGLTGKNFYKTDRYWKSDTVPIKTISFHWSDHQAQATSIFNKFANPNFKDKKDAASNPHYVTVEQARKAVEAARNQFDKAEEEDYLIAYWRLITAIRSCDVIEDPIIITKTQVDECLQLSHASIKKQFLSVEIIDWKFEIDKGYVKIFTTININNDQRVVENSFYLH